MKCKYILLVACLVQLTPTHTAQEKSGKTELKEIGKITALVCGTGLLYELAHDQLTSKYLFDNTYLRLNQAKTAAIGIAASALILNIASRYGKRKKFTADQLIKPASVGLVAQACAGAASIAAGFIGTIAAMFAIDHDTLPSQVIERMKQRGISKDKISHAAGLSLSNGVSNKAGIFVIASIVAWVLYKRLTLSDTEKVKQEELMVQLKAVKKS